MTRRGLFALFGLPLVQEPSFFSFGSSEVGRCQIVGAGKYDCPIHGQLKSGEAVAFDFPDRDSKSVVRCLVCLSELVAQSTPELTDACPEGD